MQGTPITIRTYVSLGHLAPDDVVVQAVYGRVDADDRLEGERGVPEHGRGAGETTVVIQVGELDGVPVSPEQRRPADVPTQDRPKRDHTLFAADRDILDPRLGPHVGGVSDKT